MIALAILASLVPLAIVAWVLISDALRNRRIAREIPTCYGYGKLCGTCNACARMPGVYFGPQTTQSAITVKG